jgi:DNA-binding NtrC family response regulator
MQQFDQMIRIARETNDSPEPVLAGNSVAAHALRQMAAIAAQSLEPVLLLGADESTQTDIAKVIHNQSALSAELFVDGSQGQMSADHLAVRWHGTLFLGNVGRLTQSVQHALLAWMESSDGQNVRIISAGQEPADMLRPIIPELQSRLSTLTIPYPPLAQRSEDVPIILQRLWANGTYPLPPILERSAWSAILAHGWPGNFAELQAFADKSARLYGGRQVTADHVNKLLGRDIAREIERQGFSLSQHLAQEEKLFLIEALLRSGGVVQAAANSAGLKRTTFLAKMKRHGLARY